MTWPAPLKQPRPQYSRVRSWMKTPTCAALPTQQSARDSRVDIEICGCGKQARWGCRYVMVPSFPTSGEASISASIRTRLTGGLATICEWYFVDDDRPNPNAFVPLAENRPSHDFARGETAWPPQVEYQAACMSNQSIRSRDAAPGILHRQSFVCLAGDSGSTAVPRSWTLQSLTGVSQSCDLPWMVGRSTS